MLAPATSVHLTIYLPVYLYFSNTLSERENKFSGTLDGKFKFSSPTLPIQIPLLTSLSPKNNSQIIQNRLFLASTRSEYFVELKFSAMILIAMIFYFMETKLLRKQWMIWFEHAKR